MKCDKALTRVINLINQNYLKRELIEKSVTCLLDEAKLEEIVAKLSVELDDCQIKLENKLVEVRGTPKDVLEIKAKFHELVAKINSEQISHIQQSLRISKDFQWQYLTDNKTSWKNFPVYINSLIEADYGLGKSMVFNLI